MFYHGLGTFTLSIFLRAVIVICNSKFLTKSIQWGIAIFHTCFIISVFTRRRSRRFYRTSLFTRTNWSNFTRTCFHSWTTKLIKEMRRFEEWLQTILDIPLTHNKRGEGGGERKDECTSHDLCHPNHLARLRSLVKFFFQPAHKVHPQVIRQISLRLHAAKNNNISDQVRSDQIRT